MPTRDLERPFVTPGQTNKDVKSDDRACGLIGFTPAEITADCVQQRRRCLRGEPVTFRSLEALVFDVHLLAPAAINPAQAPGGGTAPEEAGSDVLMTVPRSIPNDGADVGAETSISTGSPLR